MTEKATAVENHIASLTEGSPESPPKEPEAIDEMNQPVGETVGISPRTSQPEAVPPPQPEPEEDDSSKEANRVAAGRLNEIVKMRERLSAQNRALEQQTRNIEAMRQQMLQAEQARAEREEELLPSEEEVYGEEVVEDPAVRYLTDRLSAIEEQIASQNEAQAQAAQQQQYAARVEADFQRAFRKVKSLEQDFAAAHPDYYQAYNFVKSNRESFYAHLPDAERAQAVNAEEARFIVGALQQGANPVEMAYNMALQQGWDPNKAQQPPDPVIPQQAQPGQPDQKIKQGLEHQSLTTIPGARGGGAGGREVTMDNIYDLPFPERMKILADPEKFEQLAKKGKLHIS